MKTPAELHAASQNNRYDFLKADLALCFTFTDLAKTEEIMEHLEAAKSALDKAEEGYLTIERFSLGLDSAAQQQEIEEGLLKLRTRLDSFIKPGVNPP